MELTKGQIREVIARRVAKNTGMCELSLIHLGGYTWCFFPWLGTRSFRTMRKMIGSVSGAFGISGIDYDSCNYMTFRMERGSAEELLTCLYRQFSPEGVSPMCLVSPKELPIFEKYDRMIPAELLRHAYAVDRLNLTEAVSRLSEMIENERF